MKLSAHRGHLTKEIVTFSVFSQHSYLTDEVKESMALILLLMSPPDEFRWDIPVFKRNRFKKRRKLLLNLGSLEKDCF